MNIHWKIELQPQMEKKQNNKCNKTNKSTDTLYTKKNSKNKVICLQMNA